MSHSNEHRLHIVSPRLFLSWWAAPMAHSVRLWFRIPARSDVCHWGCAYTVYQIVQRPGGCNSTNGTLKKMLYKEPLNSFDKCRASSRLLAFFLRDIAIISRRRREAMFTDQPLCSWWWRDAYRPSLISMVVGPHMLFSQSDKSNETNGILGNLCAHIG